MRMTVHSMYDLLCILVFLVHCSLHFEYEKKFQSLYLYFNCNTHTFLFL
jgi:hypothetical protein